MDIRRAAKGLILPASGGGQAYAERTSNLASMGTTTADITGLSIAPVPDSTQMWALLYLPSITRDATATTAAQAWVSGIITDSGNVNQGSSLLYVPASANTGGLTVLTLITGLTPQTAFTIKGRFATGVGTATISSSATQRAFITALRP